MKKSLSLLAALLVVLPLSAGAAEAAPPNVVLVMTDDQGYGDVHAHGNSMIRTPNMDRLYRQSVRLTDFHVDPTCSPTRSALMSGRYSTRTGVWHTIMGRSLMSPGELTMAEVLRAGGYRTGMFGKWHLGENWPLRAEDQGFDYVVRHGGGGVGQGPDWWGNDYFDDTYFRNSKPEKFSGYCTDVWFDEAMKFIERNKDRPFFCYLATNAPHGPLNVAARWSDPYVEKGVEVNQAKFYGMIENIDWNLGKLMQQLDDLQLADNTILIFMTDNGTATGIRRNRRRAAAGEWVGFNAGMRGAKGSEYDGGHRVPFFVRWPAGGIGGGRDVDCLAAHIDVLPTVAELCGVQKPEGPPLDGVSLAKLLKDADAAAPQRTLFVHSQRILHPEKWRKSAVMTERWRLVNGQELYDIQADPGQQNDVAAEQPQEVAKLRQAYDQWWTSLSPVFEQSVRIGIGSDDEDPVQLHPHDRQVENQRDSTWNQGQVRSGHIGQGWWQLDVVRAGEYDVELRRWPRHENRPIEAVRAELQFGDDIRASREVSPADTHVTLRVTLPKGPTRLQTWLTLPDSGERRGAYFVYVTRVK